MSMMRSEIEVSVTGAIIAERQLKAVAGAEQQVAAQAMAASPAVNRLSQSMQDMTRSGMTYNSMTMTWERNTMQAAQAQRFASGVTREVTAGHLEAAKATGALATGLEAAGKGFTLLSRAAAILPGFGIAGLLLAMWQGVKALGNAFDQAEPSTRLQAAALAEYARILKEAENGVRGLQRAQAEAGGAMIGGALGIDVRALSGRARIEGARLGAEDDALKAARAKLIDEAAAIAAAERRMAEKVEAAAAMGKVTPLQGATIRGQLIIEAENIGKRRALYEAEASKTAEAEIKLQAKIEKLRMAAGLSASQKSGGGRAADAPEDPFSGPKAMAAFARQAELDAAARAASDRAQASGVAAGMAEFSKPAGGAANDDKERFAQLAMMYDEAERRTRAFFDMQAKLVDEGKNMLLGFGQAFANAAAAAILNGGGFRKLTNDLLKGLAAQALGRSLFEAASAVASLAMGNVPAAVLHGKAAAMFGAIAAGGIIGAAGTGGVGSGGGSSSSSSVSASGAGTNPYRGSGGQDSRPLIIQIGSETVARIVDGENRRRQMRGGYEVRAA